METIPERLEPLPESVEAGVFGSPPPAQGPGAAGLRRPARPLARPRTRARARAQRLSAEACQELAWVTAIYLSTRILLLAVAFVQSRFGHGHFLNELANWDGFWYRELANHGYPHVPYLGQTTLGFLPLFPITIWLLEPLVSFVFGAGPIWSATVSGVIISGVGGYITTLLVYRMAQGWWGSDSARRATILFLVFPGSVVFSMVYSEGVLLPLAAGCLYALERRRWVLAGVLGAGATAVGPTALMLVPAAAVAGLLELRRRGFTFARLRRVAPAAILPLGGIGAFAVFLWFWTGTPMASYNAQHYGWKESTDPLALVHLVGRLAAELHLHDFNHPSINLNLIVGLIGGLMLVWMLGLIVSERRTMSAAAITWTFGVAFLALTSEFVPPNPRMLITAFPALLAVGHRVSGKWFRVLVWGNGIALVGLSLLTFWGLTLRP